MADGRLLAQRTRLEGYLSCTNPLARWPANADAGDDTGTMQPGLTLLERKENEGMDIAAHNSTVDWVTARGER